MSKLTSNQIRQQFLDFFKSKEHDIVPSSPVVPYDDPTLLFTNAGMNQFKPIFLGTVSPNDPHAKMKRAADTQKCIRAGGKHNDLDDVGKDTYHHTFFEMLGNWSFGDYFKKEAIEWAWELLTKVWKIDKSRLHATYFQGDESEGLEPDGEAAALWRTVTDIDPSHIHPGNKKDNFWEMGESGPCGPCSEIHIDLTPDKSGGHLVNAGDARVMEVWNLVFIQFNRGSDGKLTPLPAKHVDTGMGFERICSVLQSMEADRLGSFSNYDTDVFTPIFRAIKERTNAPEYRGTLPSEPGASAPDSENREPPSHQSTKAKNSAASDQNRDREGAANQSRERERSVSGEQVSVGPVSNRSSTSERATPLSPPLSKGGTQRGLPVDQIMTDVSYRVIADHLRCLTFALTDGAVPSNEGRGYVLRRILRRAVRYGRQYLNMHEPFLCDLVPSLVNGMGDVFPELRSGPDPKRQRDNVAHVAGLLREEEASFFKTLERGLVLYFDAIGHAFIRTFLDSSDLSTDRGGPFDLFVESTRFSAGGQEYSGWDNAHEYFTKTPRKFRIVRHTQGKPDLDNPVRVFSISDFSGALFQELQMPSPIIAGVDVFRLHGTYGFPVDLTELMAEEGGLTIDIEEYERLMEEARGKARTKVQLLADESFEHLRNSLDSLTDVDSRLGVILAVGTQFTGYNELETSTRVGPTIWFRGDSQRANTSEPIEEGNDGAVIIEKSPFYVESGGQVADHGVIVQESGTMKVIKVERTDKFSTAISRHTGGKSFHGHIIHYGRVEKGRIIPQAPCVARVDASRIQIMQNHTATHIMNWALREVLGDHVQQKGSLVDPEKTRFDLSHPHPISNDELARIEKLTNEQIAKKLRVYAASNEEGYIEQDEALKIKTLRAVFGEKYPPKVRVVSIGAPVTEMDAREAGEPDWLLRSPDDPKWMKYSVEFCGGTHVDISSKVERFVIVSEEGVAKGVRRVVGVTGETARKAEEEGQRLLREIESLASRGLQPPTASDNLAVELAKTTQSINDAVIPILVRHELREKIAELQKVAKQHEKQSAAASGDAVMDKVKSLHASAQTIGGVIVVVGEVPAAPVDALRGAIDWIRQKSPSSAVLLAMVDDNRVTLLAGMSKDVVDRGVKAGDLIKEISPLVGGKGGGRPDMAQGGGTDAGGISTAVESGKQWLAMRLKQV